MEPEIYIEKVEIDVNNPNYSLLERKIKEHVKRFGGVNVVLEVRVPESNLVDLLEDRNLRRNVRIVCNKIRDVENYIKRMKSVRIIDKWDYVAMKIAKTSINTDFYSAGSEIPVLYVKMSYGGSFGVRKAIFEIIKYVYDGKRIPKGLVEKIRAGYPIGYTLDELVEGAKAALCIL